ncbi:hypothetical protein NOQ67_002150 [Enterococcus faecalis]|uniref:hypothetical protein n=1 Tax=Enterococcus faecalis TaxID=1351 RepID=UPI0013D7D1E3|nr:hypothetical protein [Enterococcus faecalis]EJM6035840.1 hypothetical protein [Enterococcus faecalis]NFA63719.1 hypothetical protein [Enterococcus faecalis]HAP3019622.1 hypothetical protein [Enterococcus faecalis]
MQIKDYITIGISLVALFFSFGSLIFTFLNFRRNATKLKITQLQFAPNPFGIKITPNKLFLDRQQSTDFCTVVPILYLVIYLKIDNLSHTGITISNFIINDEFLVSKVNIEEIKEQVSLAFFASKKCQNRDLTEFGHAVSMAATYLEPDDYTLIKVGDRIESKSSVEGIIIVSGNWELYSTINDGKNKFTIVTPDKKFDSYIKIDKTIIPSVQKNDSESE